MEDRYFNPEKWIDRWESSIVEREKQIRHLKYWTTNRPVKGIEKDFVKKKIDFPLNALLGFGS